MIRGELDSVAKDRFWDVVEACLVAFHSYKSCDAQCQTADLRKRLENAPAGVSADLIYHDEPFDVAGDIAGKSLDLSKHWHRYEKIAQTHNW